LTHLGVVNVGAAGTFVVRKPIGRKLLRAELGRRLPFGARIVICRGREIASLVSRNPFADHPAGSDVVRFVSVLAQRPRSAPPMPVRIPSTGKWLVRILGRENRFVFGLYRRHMKVISYLGTLDRLFGVPVTTRNWKTISAIAEVLNSPGRGRVTRGRR
jgi:uncharacterized protein (DUF1697 family)